MKTKLFMVILLCLFLLTGCIDIFQAITLNKGQVSLIIKFTMQKAIFDMGSSFSGEETDYEEFLNEGTDIFDPFEEINGTVTPIETEYEIGAELSIKGSLKDITLSLGDEIQYIPVFRENRVEILIPAMGDPSEEADEFGAAFLSGAKYRLLLDMSGDLRKYPLARIREEKSNNEISDKISINRYGSSLLIEIPLILLMYTDDNIIIELHPREKN